MMTFVVEDMESIFIVSVDDSLNKLTLPSVGKTAHFVQMNFAG